MNWLQRLFHRHYPVRGTEYIKDGERHGVCKCGEDLTERGW